MPLIGWICVSTVARLFGAFEKFIPWIALILLGYIGGKMLYEGIKCKETEEEKTIVGLKGLLVQGIATSIDALSVGFTISDYNWKEAWHNKYDELNKPNRFEIVLLILYGLYPLVSYLFGNGFPQMVTYVMPCPIVSLSLAVYAGYSHKNRLLLLLLTIWGLTGVKSIIFNTYEDIILLMCGIYGVYLLVRGFKGRNDTQTIV